MTDLTNRHDEAVTHLTLKDIAKALTALRQALNAAREEQWDAPDVAVSSERPHRPTEDIALDPRRLALRAAVLSAESELRLTLARLWEAHNSILRALQAYTEG